MVSFVERAARARRARLDVRFLSYYVQQNY